MTFWKENNSYSGLHPETVTYHLLTPEAVKYIKRTNVIAVGRLKTFSSPAFSTPAFLMVPRFPVPRFQRPHCGNQRGVTAF